MPIFNRITYGPVKTKVTKYSHTPNVKDDGTQNGNYTNNMSTNDVVTIPGASKLHVKITYGGESAKYDWVSVWQGAHSDYKAESDYSKAILGAQKLGGGSHTSSSNTKEFDVDGDSVTFGFKSDYSGYGDGYGYYAVITADVTPDVTSEAYAVFDSSDGSFTFFRDDKGKYTDGQVSGTKTYYAGFEDITVNTYPSWFDYDNYKQKNTIKTVIFKDKIKPKTCYRWFNFANALTSITGLDKLDTENVTNMTSMFDICSSLTSLDVSSFNTENVTDMTFMFRYCSGLTSLDLSSFNTENVTDMKTMFAFNSSLKTIYASSLFTTDTVDSSSNMFYGCTSLVGGAGTTYNKDYRDKTYARIDGGASNPGYFTAKAAYAVFDSSDGSFTFFRDDKGKYTDGQVSGTKTYYAGFEDITGDTDPSWFDSGTYEQKNQIKTVTFKDKIKPKTCHDWFNNADYLVSITGLDKLDTTAVKDMDAMFYRCAKLTSLDLSSFNTENVMNMWSMFYYCRKLKTIYASSLFTTDAVNWSENMFYNNTSLVGGAGTKYNASNVDKTYAKIDGGTSNPGYFTAK